MRLGLHYVGVEQIAQIHILSGGNLANSFNWNGPETRANYERLFEQWSRMAELSQDGMGRDAPTAIAALEVTMRRAAKVDTDDGTTQFCPPCKVESTAAGS